LLQQRFGRSANALFTTSHGLPAETAPTLARPNAANLRVAGAETLSGQRVLV
jgi:hypothetical protein